MSKIVRKIQKIFGSNAGFQQMVEFGSLANSAPVYTTDVAVMQSLSQYLDGWYEAVIGDNSPAIEDMNALFYIMAYQIAYLMQQGIAEWEIGTTYFVGSQVSDGLGNNYVSITDNNVGNILTDFVNWNFAGGTTVNVNPANVTVTVGKTFWYPNYTIPAGSTWTVNVGGYLLSASNTVVNGTLIVNGTSRII